jgi:hypothetical protein
MVDTSHHDRQPTKMPSPTIKKKKKNYRRPGFFKFKDKEYTLDPSTFYIFTNGHKLRWLCLWLIEWPWFDRFIMLSIVLNSLSLALNDYEDMDGATRWNQVLAKIGDIFSIIFIVECALKTIALGFFVHKKAYLRDYWNVLDFIIVVTGLIELFSAGLNLKSLRTMRVLRPLKSITTIPTMRRLVKTLMTSLPELFNVFIFLCFIFTLFGILGLQTYQGVLYNKCRETKKPINATYWPRVENINRVCSMDGEGLYSCPSRDTGGNPIESDIGLEYEYVETTPSI